MQEIAGLEIRVLSALRGLIIDVRCTLSFTSSATVPAHVDGTRGGPTRRPARGLLQAASSQRYMPNRQNLGEPAYLFQKMKRSDPKAVRQTTAASSSFSANQCF